MTTQQFEIWNAETFPPVVWDIRKNVRFQDIKEENWDKALEFLKVWKNEFTVKENLFQIIYFGSFSSHSISEDMFCAKKVCNWRRSPK